MKNKLHIFAIHESATTTTTNVPNTCRCTMANVTYGMSSELTGC